MPSGRVHKKDSQLKNYDNKVNQFIDLPYKWLGNKHRIFFHTPEEAMTIGYMIDGIDGAIGGLSHIILDNIKDKSLKNALEYMATTKSSSKRSKERFITINMDLENLMRIKPIRAKGEILSVTPVSPSTDEIMHLLEVCSKLLILLMH